MNIGSTVSSSNLEGVHNLGVLLTAKIILWASHKVVVMSHNSEKGSTNRYLNLTGIALLAIGETMGTVASIAMGARIYYALSGSIGSPLAVVSGVLITAGCLHSFFLEASKIRKLDQQADSIDGLREQLRMAIRGSK